MKKTINYAVVIRVPIDKVWEALVDGKVIEQWGAGPAKMEARAGVDFSFWGGDIYGTNLSVKPMKELVQAWLTKGWKEPSRVVFRLEALKKGTRVRLSHSRLPEDEYEEIKKGWNHYFFEPMKVFLEEKYNQVEVEYHQG